MTLTNEELELEITNLKRLIHHHHADHEVAGGDQVRIGVMNGNTLLGRHVLLRAGTGLTATEVAATNGIPDHVNLVSSALSGEVDGVFVIAMATAL